MRLDTREIPTPDSNSYHAQTLHTSAVVFVSKQSSSRHYRENIQSGDYKHIWVGLSNVPDSLL